MLLFFLVFWPINGIPVFADDSLQWNSYIVKDSLGGVYVTWDDFRDGNYNIYTQRVSETGNLLWSPAGKLVCNNPGHQFIAIMVEDGTGGALLGWIDARSNYDFNLYGQRVDEDGNLIWPDSTVICNASGSQFFPQGIPEGNGGMIVAWQDHRSSDNDIYIQRIDSAGNGCWQTNGLPICISSGSQDAPKLSSLGNDRYLILWNDNRYGDYDIYGQMFDLNGNLYWEPNGKELVSFFSHQSLPKAMAVDDSNFVVVWEDCRDGDIDLYAQKFNRQGVALWDSNGVGLGIGADFQRNAQLIADSAGGVFVCWEDARLYLTLIHCQHLDALGTRLWGMDGIIATPSNDIFHNPLMVLNGYGGIIIQWCVVNTGRIYAQSLDSLGNFIWQSSGVPVCNIMKNCQCKIIDDIQGGFYSVWTKDPNAIFNTDIFLQRIRANGAPGIQDNPNHELIDFCMYPNPSRGKITFLFSNPGFNLSVYEITGRCVFERKISSSHFFWNCLDNIGRKVSAGVYFVRVKSNSGNLCKKIIIIK